ncbi:MAG: nucleotidyltransferase domain-containing protein [Nanopusillaceae archaeon]
MEMEILEYLNKSKFKERILGIEIFKEKKEEIVKLLEDLYFYAKKIDTLDIEEFKKRYEDELKSKDHLVILISDYDLELIEDKLRIKYEILENMINFVKEKNLNLWIQVLTMSDIKDISMDSRFDLLDLLASGEIIYDKGILEIFKLVVLHKNLLLETFSKYVVAYALAGSQVKGKNVETSDVDVYVIIDDTDVKKHTYEELKSKLYQIVGSKAVECQIILNSKKILHPQVYTLTEFWYSLAEANPVIYTFLRDGIAFYDRGIYIAWKQLLAKGIIKPSREAGDKLLTSSDLMIKETKEKLKTTINVLLIENVAVSMITSAQAVLMSYGLPPVDPKETIGFLKEIFVKEKKILEEDYVKNLEEIWSLRKKFEHGEIKEFEYNDLIKWIDTAEKFINRMKSLKSLIDKEREKQELIYYIEEYNVLKARLEEIYNKKVEEIINEKFQNLDNLFKEVEQGIKYYLDGKTDILEYSKLKENIKILNRAFKDYLSGITEDVISKYSYKIQNKDGNIFDLILFEDKVYLISDKIEIYNYEGEKLEEMDKKDFWKILKELNKLKITIDENVVKFLDKVFGKFTIYK